MKTIIAAGLMLGMASAAHAADIGEGLRREGQFFRACFWPSVKSAVQGNPSMIALPWRGNSLRAGEYLLLLPDGTCGIGGRPNGPLSALPGPALG